MPLSEHEQRMLRQIERQLQQERGLARSLRMPVSSKQAARNVRAAAVGFIVGLVALLASFASSWVVGLTGFLVMLGSAVVFVQSTRRLAEDRWAACSQDDDEGPEGSGRRPSEGGWWPRWRANDSQDGEAG